MDGLGKLGIGVASLCIILVVTFLIMATANTNMKADATACVSGVWNATSSTCCLADTNCLEENLSVTSLAYNATGTLTEATATIPGWVSIIIITVIGALLIGMVKMFKR